MVQVSRGRSVLRAVKAIDGGTNLPQFKITATAKDADAEFIAEVDVPADTSDFDNPAPAAPASVGASEDDIPF